MHADSPESKRRRTGIGSDRSYFGHVCVSVPWIVSAVLVLTAPVLAQSALHLAGTGQSAHTGTIPGYSLGDFYIAVRLHKPTGTLGSGDQWPIFAAGAIACGLASGGGLRSPGPPSTKGAVSLGFYCYDQITSSDYGISVELTGKSDVIVKFRRDRVNSAYYVDAWDGAGNFLGTNKRCPGPGQICTGETTYTHSGAATIGSTSSTFDIDFIQWDSGAAFSPIPPANVPAVHPAYGEWGFENALTDASGNNLTLTMSTPVSACTGGTLVSGACFLGSPIYNPISSIGGTRYGLAGNQTITLSSAASYSSANPNGVPSSFVFSVPSKPAGGSGTLGTPNAATTTMALNDTFGTYSVQLAVTDSRGIGTSTTKIGVAPENADHTLKYYTNPTSGLNDPLIRAVTGPLTRYGASTYTDFENEETVLSDQLPWAAHVPVEGYTTSLPGTVHLSNVAGTWHVICDDPAGHPCNFTSYYRLSDDGNGHAYSHIWLWWDAPGDHMGRAEFELATPLTITNSDIVITATGASLYFPFLTGSGYQHSQPNDYDLGAWNGGNANWNYYDNALALLRRYLRTGQDDYLTKFRLVADTHWIVALDHGYLIPMPRITSMLGLMARALDGRPEMWAGIKQYLLYGDFGLHSTTPLPPGYAFGDIREGAYLSRGRAVMARGAQNSDGSTDTATRADFCTRSREDTENVWVAGQAADGSWILGDALFAANYTYPSKGPAVSPWHMAFPTGALILSRDLMLSGACDSTLTHATAVQVAADALASLKKAVDFQFNSLDANNGMFFMVNAEAYANGGSYNDGTYLSGTASASGPGSSTTVTGSGTTFLTNFLPDGTTYIGIKGAAAIYRVDHAVSNTSLLLTANYPEASISGQYAKAETCTAIAGPGLITVAANSTRVTGDINTTFSRNFYGDNNCDPAAAGSHDCATYIVPFGDRRAWQVKHVIDDHTMDLSLSYTDTALTNHTYEKAGGCTTHCSPSSATTCYGGQDGDPTGTVRGNPQLNIESMAAFAYYGKAAGDSSYFTKANALFTTSFPAGSYPLTALAYTGQAGKQYGQKFGAGDNPNLLAYIAVTGPCSSLSFSPTFAAPPATGGTGTFNATVSDSSCDRSVTSSAGWLTCSVNCTGTGSVTGIGWSAAANAGPARSATLTGGGVQFTVNQAGTVSTGGPNTMISGGHSMTGGISIQ